VRAFYDGSLDFAANFAPVIAALEQFRRGERPGVPGAGGFTPQQPAPAEVESAPV
jgi:hypothetical protein